MADELTGSDLDVAVARAMGCVPTWYPAQAPYWKCECRDRPHAGQGRDERLYGELETYCASGNGLLAMLEWARQSGNGVRLGQAPHVRPGSPPDEPAWAILTNGGAFEVECGGATVGEALARAIVQSASERLS